MEMVADCADNHPWTIMITVDKKNKNLILFDF